MQKDGNKKKIPTSVDIVDVPPPIYNDTEGEDVFVSAGTTQLSNEELHHLWPLAVTILLQMFVLINPGSTKTILIPNGSIS